MKYPSGRKMEETTYKDGERVGTQTVWYPNGQKSTEWKGGGKMLDGTWTVWNKDGEKIIDETFKNGKVIKKKKGDKK